MSFSRRIGASPSMCRRARLSPLRMTAVPTMIRLIGLRGQRQRRLRQLLTGVEGEEIRSLLVLIGEHEAVGSGAERQHHAVREVLPVLQHGQVRAEVEACERSFVVPASRSAIAASMSALAAQLFAEAAMPSPVVPSATPVIVRLVELVSLKTTIRLSGVAPIRLTPL